MTHTVVGLFDDRAKAQAATQELVQKGFIRDNIDVSTRRYDNAETVSTQQVTITEPTISDNISEFFSSLFSSDKNTAKNHTRAAVDADAVICIQVDSFERAREAAAILDRHGAIDVDSQVEKTNRQNVPPNQANQPNLMNFAPGAQQNTANIQGERTIPIIEEQLQLDKQVVEQGGARIRSRIIEKPVEASLRLREEHVVVNRRPVDRAVTQADLAGFKDEEFVLTERAEVPVIGKQARVVEEIVVGKNVTERNEIIRETVRRTDVEVENIETGVDADADLSTRRAAS
jgi:uncharacterized protein (TIGR02271 family)